MKGGISKYPYSTIVDFHGRYIFSLDSLEPEKITALKANVSSKKAEYLDVLEQIVSCIKRLGGQYRGIFNEPFYVQIEVCFTYSADMDKFMDEYKNIIGNLPPD